MSYFANIDTTIIVATLEFVEIASHTVQQFRCKSGEVAGFRIITLPVLGEAYVVSQVYDCSTGTPVLKGTTSALPGMDLTGGLFSSGCVANGDPYDIATKFYKVDYV